jgi:hypothetical protein
MKVGDRIQITTAPWQGEQGVIESVNGAYHLVRRDGVHPDDIIELYPNEMRLVNKAASI